MFSLLFFLLLGFLLLVKGADFLVKGSVGFARMLNISEFVVGLTICALGTSAPELLVTAVSSFKGEEELALSNVIGSNLVNLLLALGIAGFASTVKFSRSILTKNFAFSILVTSVLFILLNDELFAGSSVSSNSILSRSDGLILLIFLVIFVGTLLMEKNTTSINSIEENDSSNEQASIWKNSIYVILGCIGLFGGGKFVVDSSINLSNFWGVPKDIVGLVVTSIGTSLPEIVTSFVAVNKNNSDVALGNIIGSNIFNICLVLGVGSIIHNIHLTGYINWDIGTLFISSLLLFFVMIFRKSNQLTKLDALFLVSIYMGYLVFLYLRTVVF